MADFDAIKRSLEERLAALRRRTARIEADLRKPGDRDSEERATELQNDEVLERLDEAELSEMRQIQAALSRIEEGSYGRCAGCGDPIAPGRLQALPVTTLCIDCAD